MSLELLNDVANVGVLPDMRPNPEMAVGRRCFSLSEVEDQAMSCVKNRVVQLFASNNFPKNFYELREDAFGSLFVTVFGRNREKTVVSGSHIDSVIDGGKFDGVAGVQSAYNFLEHLVRSKQVPKCNYCLAVFRAEESSPANITACLGSGIATGTITEEELLLMTYGDMVSKKSLKDHFISRYGEDRWEAVLEEVHNPIFNATNTETYEELHIEQSSVIRQSNKDLGIVILGIGGARRELYTLSSPEFLTQSLRVTPENPYKRFALTFVGEEAHTAGAPPNPTFSVVQKDRAWYRSDALVSAAHFMKQVMKKCLSEGVRVSFEKIRVPKERGFTTVTPEQIIQCIVPADQASRFQEIIKHYDRLPEFKNTEFTCKETEDVSCGNVKVCDTHQFLQFLGVPLFVEQLTRRTVYSQGGIGRVRATVTDFTISSEKGIQFKIDYRDIDTSEGDCLKSKVWSFLESIPELAILKLASASRKQFSKICEVATEMKRQIVKTLGFAPLEMPSMPGHDASRFSQAGVKTTMTFVRHPGASHNPKENMHEEDFHKAQALSHAFLAHVLEVSRPARS